jgi:hypothetical protein
MALVLVAILGALGRWDVADVRVDEDRPDLRTDPDRRRASRLGLAEHALEVYRREIARLAPGSQRPTVRARSSSTPRRQPRCPLHGPGLPRVRGLLRFQDQRRLSVYSIAIREGLWEERLITASLRRHSR